jgi:hypothetical protein
LCWRCDALALYAQQAAEQAQRDNQPPQNRGGPSDYCRAATDITHRFAHLGTAAAARAIVEKIPDLLRLDVGSLPVGAWKKYAELQKYRDSSAYPPGETMLVELAQHTIHSSDTPHLDVMVGESRVQRIDFALDLALDVEGAVLTVRDGKIWAVSLGSCKASGELTYKEYSLLKRESKPVALPGTYAFKEPIEIAMRS